MPPAKVDTGSVRRLWEAGLTDAAIAARLGWDPETVRKNRRLVGLPSRHDRSAWMRDHGGAIRAARIDAAARCRQDLAGRYGLPGDLKPLQVLAVIALAGGPLTAGDLADRVGKARRPSHRTHYHRFQCPRVAGGNYLTDLRRRGLVTLIHRSRGPAGGSGRGDGLYLLTPEAMCLLTCAGRAGG